MPINVQSALGIGAAAILCSLAAFLAYDAEVNVAPLVVEPTETSSLGIEPGAPAIPESKVKEDWDDLLGMGMREDLYRKDGFHEEADLEGEMARQKIGRVAQEYLGVEFVPPDALSFFMSESTFGRGPPTGCDHAEGVPAHLAEIRESEWFGEFSGKYSQYGIKMGMSESPEGGTSYGFFAESGDGTHAITYFHADPCTGQTAALNEHLLACMSGEYGHNFLSSDRGDITASLGLEEFCFIPITDPWRQSVYDYADGLTDALMPLFDDPRTSSDYDSAGELAQDARSLVILRAASLMVASDSFEYEAIYKVVQGYCDEFGPLPEDFAALVERGGQYPRLAAC